MSKSSNTWICCQIGAREHYSIPIALHQKGYLNCLVTDTWVSPHSWLNSLPKSCLINLRNRFHPYLTHASIKGFNISSIQFELGQLISNIQGWKQTIARNNWFQNQALGTLEGIANQLKTTPILFSYSYAALDLFRFAKQRGWQTVLGQIDPGIEEEKLVEAEYKRHPEYQSNWHPAPPSYWNDWHEECQLADHILVNSSWSCKLLQQQGIAAEKIRIVPLVYTPPTQAQQFSRTYPQMFSPERPLRVLFLGQVILRKGIAALLDAIAQLEKQPIEFWIVGSQQITVPSQLQRHPQIRWIAQVPRSQTFQYYQLADVFLFPTLSDGFGLTQLEAQAWRLPIIASCYCGDVVKDGVNGWLLDQVSGEAIANILQSCLNFPQQLRALAQNSQLNPQFTLDSLAEHLLRL